MSLHHDNRVVRGPMCDRNKPRDLSIPIEHNHSKITINFNTDHQDASKGFEMVVSALINILYLSHAVHIRGHAMSFATV